ncbi:MAG: DEAD/DEAH box helicase [Erysipelotrichaceae bacterium]|nr:DEAD/DEAH box helicase [Erysipelotrichaceae bacterium]
MICKRCGNSDPAFFYNGHKGVYCRKCVRFRRILLEEEAEGIEYETDPLAAEPQFAFPLTAKQEEISRACRQALQEEDVLLLCVTGAGKTEISVESLAACLKAGKKAAYAIARREVVVELSQRFAQIFPYARVTAVYGGHSEELEGDLIVCTTHEYYRC